MNNKLSKQEREQDAIRRQADLSCKHCGQFVDEHRVYFGVVGPFCNTECREAWIKLP